MDWLWFGSFVGEWYVQVSYGGVGFVMADEARKGTLACGMKWFVVFRLGGCGTLLWGTSCIGEVSYGKVCSGTAVWLRPGRLGVFR